jgi:hypothetical protein
MTTFDTLLEIFLFSVPFIAQLKQMVVDLNTRLHEGHAVY